SLREWRGVLLAYSVALDADGGRVAAWGQGPDRKPATFVWRADNGAVACRLKDTRTVASIPAARSALAFSPDGKRLAVALGQRAADPLVIFDAATGNRVASLPMPQNALAYRHLAWSADGRRLLAGPPGVPTAPSVAPGASEAWDAATGAA